jgi:hypothetical protein
VFLDNRIEIAEFVESCSRKLGVLYWGLCLSIIGSFIMLYATSLSRRAEQRARVYIQQSVPQIEAQISRFRCQLFLNENPEIR